MFATVICGDHQFEAFDHQVNRVTRDANIAFKSELEERKHKQESRQIAATERKRKIFGT
jgi:hypothetical protein